MADQSMSDFNRQIIDEFRANNGKVGGPFEGANMVLLHTTGAKSGQPRVNPVVYRPVGDDLAVFASAAGAHSHPAWFHNLKADPEVTIELGGETLTAVAREATGAERDEIWEAQKADAPGFAEYEAKTDRTIPVVLLTPSR